MSSFFFFPLFLRCRVGGVCGPLLLFYSSSKSSPCGFRFDAWGRVCFLGSGLPWVIASSNRRSSGGGPWVSVSFAWAGGPFLTGGLPSMLTNFIRFKKASSSFTVASSNKRAAAIGSRAGRVILPSLYAWPFKRFKAFVYPWAVNSWLNTSRFACVNSLGSMFGRSFLPFGGSGLCVTIHNKSGRSCR